MAVTFALCLSNEKKANDNIKTIIAITVISINVFPSLK